jgi:hypothetical protein
MVLPIDFTFEKYGLKLRFVNENDADFIIRLRTNPKLNRFLHPTSPDIEKQKEWISDYKLREKKGTDYYFIFFFNGQPIGLNRIYNIEENSFTSGSWIFDPDGPIESSIASALISRIIAFDILEKEIEYSNDGCHIDNKKVLRFNLMLGLIITGTRNDSLGTFYTFSMSKSDFYKNKPIIEKLIGYNHD